MRVLAAKEASHSREWHLVPVNPNNNVEFLTEICKTSGVANIRISTSMPVLWCLENSLSQRKVHHEQVATCMLIGMVALDVSLKTLVLFFLVLLGWSEQKLYFISVSSRIRVMQFEEIESLERQ